MPTWPADLPQSLRLGFTDTRRDGTIRTAMDAGPEKVRRRYSNTSRRLDAVTLLLTGEQRMILEDFYLYDTAEGSLSFTFTDPNNLASCECRFIGPPTYQTVAGAPDRYDQLHRATMRLELLDSSPYGAIAGPFINRVLGDGGTLMKSRVETDQEIRENIDGTISRNASFACYTEFGGYKAGKIYSQLPTSGAGDLVMGRSGTKRVLGSAGLLVEYAANVPAYEFNLDGTYRGVVIEPAASNIIQQSETFSNAYWSKVASTISANTAVAPDGATTADSLVPDVTSNQHRLDVTSTSTAADHTFSVWAKPNGYNFISLRAGALGCAFNLTTGANGTTTGGATARAVQFPNGWWRFSISGSLGASAICRINVENALSIGTSFTGNGTSSILIWGAQLETGLSATSYIPTVSATANRVADDITKTGVSAIIGQSQGYIAAQFEVRSTGTDRTVYTVYEDANNHITLRVDTSRQLVGEVVSGGVTQATFTSSVLAENTKYAAVLSYSAGAVLLSLNGAQVGATDTSATIPATSKLGAGISRNGDQRLNGRLRLVENGATALSLADANAHSLALSTQ